ncbi:MAG: hypothetical protein SF053_06735 [Bacteroidia bacterium]|nr:hypothetical protein [Bacteroidia bacterium]
MKHLIISFLLLAAVTQYGRGQDLLVAMDSTRQSVRVLEIRPKSLLIQYVEGQDTVVAEIDKANIAFVLYEDSMQQFFSLEASQAYVPEANSDSASQAATDMLYLKGQIDAENNYRPTGPFWGTLGTTLFYPIGGIATGLITGSIILAVPVKPPYKYLPDPDLYATNRVYAAGYDKQAQKKKTQSVIKAFLIGAATQTALLVLIVSSF